MTEGGRPSAERYGRLARLRDTLLRHRNAVAWLTGLLLIGFSIRVLVSNTEPLKKLLAMPIWLWALLLPLTLGNIALTAWRMALAMIQAGSPRIGPLTWFRIVALGQFLNVLLPQLGNVYRGVALKREQGVSYVTYSMGLITFVWLDMLTSIGLGLVAVAILAPGLRFGALPVLPVMALASVVLMAAPSIALRITLLLAPQGGPLLKLRELSARLLGVLTQSLKQPRFLGGFTLINLLSLVDQASVLWVCFREAGLPIDASLAALFHVVIKLSNVIIVTPGNLGVTELAFGALGMGTHGGSLPHGIAAALAFRALNTLVVIGLGLGFGGVGLIRSTRAAAAAATE
jgi:uncharacterized membrane protein YbhN (UPF0104 family)